MTTQTEALKLAQPGQTWAKAWDEGYCQGHIVSRLYSTTTSLRKPLTTEDLRKLADKHLFYQPEGYEVSGVFVLARAIEAAHGIKE
ncbi:hypothetical protein UFOVP249_72 [uncultured Caudovirales phage]|uniref:Uncharacterized protein n=1 Tax=uncultured Caudovirales phage TaxID=2100421 RepID=A0A6J5LE95_9CAUD|nr:hypothetical protein UFOVP249_72 [uncultured Caudovirales phage]